MSFTFTLAQGGTMVIPDSAVNINVANNPSGSSTSGVVVLVGEADEGLSWSQDQALGNKLSSNFYGANDLARVQAKYGSGRLVDAFRGAIAPSASPRITGGPNSIILVKTNNSSPAAIATADGHGIFTARRGGAPGNQIQESVSSSTPEVAPSTGNFTYIPFTPTASMLIRVNGGAAQTLPIAAYETPSSLAAAITNLANLNAVGGVDRSVLAGLTGQNIQLQVISGPNVVITLASPNVFTNAPQVGDTLHLAGVLAASVGWYEVTAVSNVSGAATINARMYAATPAGVATPVAVAPTPIVTPATDLTCYSSIQINNMSGTNRNVLTALPTLVGQMVTVSVIGSQLTATLAPTSIFAGLPTAGDLVYIPAGSAFAGAGSANVGWYQMTLVSNTSALTFLQMSRLSNGLPVAVASTAIAAITDIQVLDPQIKGLGKTLELYDGGGAVNVNTQFKQLGLDVPATWLQTMLVSSAELRKTITTQRNATNTLESFVVGGNVVLSIGYIGTSGTVTIGPVGGVLTLTTSIVGGNGANLNIDLSKVSTLADLVSRINGSQTGYSASLGTTTDGQRNPSVLDQGTFGIASSLGNRPARIKRDLWDLISGNTGISGSSLVTYSPLVMAGLPTDNTPTFLANGAKGATSGLQFSQSIDALQGVRTNFVVPLISQNASLDAAINSTDPASTYTVDACNAAVKSHVLAMSTPKIKRHRVGIVSKRGTFNEAKASAQTMATFRIAHLFQDVIDLDSNGNLVQQQPWYGSAKAAGMQAAGAYKSIFNKTVNISGAIQAANDYDDESVSQTEDALLSGLIPLQRQENGGYNFVSDQMTYSIDNNFVYNSLQAVYVADLMALDLAASLKNAFVGESVADVTTGAVESFIKSKMAEYLGRKYTVGTKQAPGGWKSIGINIIPGVLSVSVVAVEATSIYFIPIDLNIEGIQNSATASGT